MRRGPDRVSEEDQAHHEFTSGLFDRLYLLAEQIASYEGEGTPIDDDMMTELAEIDDELFMMTGVTFRFSGEGFVPASVPVGNGEVAPGTVYTYVSNVSGTYAALHPADGSYFDFFDPDEFVASEDGDTLSDPHFERLRRRLKEPEAGTRLYIEFKINHSPEEENIGGEAIRADGVTHYAIMDLARLALEGIEYSNTTYELIDVEDIDSELDRQSKRFRKMLHDRHFRHRPVSEQEILVDSELEHLNDQLRLDRFTMYFPVPELYVTSGETDTLRIQRVGVPEEVLGFSITPIRVDSLFSLTKDNPVHQSKRVIDPRAGLCIVAQVDTSVQEKLGLPHNIVWVPIRPNGSDNKFGATVEPKGFEL